MPDHFNLSPLLIRLNHPLLSTAITASFRAWATMAEVRDVDYFFDSTERVWVVRSGPTYLAVGFRPSRFRPSMTTAYVDQRLRDSRDWYLGHATFGLGAVVLDLGAADGCDTILFSQQVGPTGRVIAVEAHPETARLLRSTCHHNRLDNVTIVEAAIADKAGEVSITQHHDYILNSIRPVAGEGPRARHRVRALTVDQLCLEYEITSIDYLKMNIEGSELEAINGMDLTVGRLRSACIACHDFIGARAGRKIQEDVTRFMSDRGFAVSARPADPRPWVREHLYVTAAPSDPLRRQVP